MAQTGKSRLRGKLETLKFDRFQLMLVVLWAVASILLVVSGLRISTLFGIAAISASAFWVGLLHSARRSREQLSELRASLEELRDGVAGVYRKNQSRFAEIEDLLLDRDVARHLAEAEAAPDDKSENRKPETSQPIETAPENTPDVAVEPPSVEVVSEVEDDEAAPPATKDSETNKGERVFAKIFSRRRKRPDEMLDDDPQKSLGLGNGSPLEQTEVAKETLIRALNFPNNAEDAEGFAALRVAIQDHSVKQIVQSAQDVLTLISHDGVYVDDIEIATLGAETWKSYAEGNRAVISELVDADLSGADLDVLVQRLRKDVVFRDAVHHFLRRFDRLLISFAQDATEDALEQLGNTRSGQAFVILGSAVGIFS